MTATRSPDLVEGLHAADGTLPTDSGGGIGLSLERDGEGVVVVAHAGGWGSFVGTVTDTWFFVADDRYEWGSSTTYLIYWR